MEPYATVSDLEARWRPLSDAEKKRAEVLLGDATAFISGQGPVGAYEEELRAACCNVVKRQMMPPLVGVDTAPLSQFTQTAGPFSFSATPANASCDMFLTAAEKDMLGIGRCSAFFVGLSIGGT